MYNNYYIVLLLCRIIPIHQMPERTSILIHRPTVDRLREIGRFGETYDGLINRLLDERQLNRGENTGE